MNMLRIGTVCGSGLGSSFMLEMNIQSILKDMNISNDKVVVNHYDLGNASANEADVWVVGRDLADSANHLGETRVLNSIIDMDELKEVVKKIIDDNGIN